jgi:hypothetical protein
MKELIDIIFNGQIVGSMDIDEADPLEKVAKQAETFFPRRSLTIKKVIFSPHKNIAFVEKVA